MNMAQATWLVCAPPRATVRARERWGASGTTGFTCLPRLSPEQRLLRAAPMHRPSSAAPTLGALPLLGVSSRAACLAAAGVQEQGPKPKIQTAVTAVQRLEA